MTDPPTRAQHLQAVRPDDEMLWERRYKAATLRNGGLTIDAISKQLHVSTGTVRKDITMVLHEAVQDSLEDMVARQRTVLADMQRAVYRAALGGDVAAVQTVLRVLDHEAKLFGLFAPERVNLGISDMEFASQVAELIGALRPDTIRELTRGHIDAEVVGDDQPVPGAASEDRRNGHAAASVAFDGDGGRADDLPDTSDGEPWSNL